MSLPIFLKPDEDQSVAVPRIAASHYELLVESGTSNTNQRLLFYWPLI